APRHIIMIIASLGIIAGVTFSSGMMEVARKGIMHPDQFYFSEIMMIFLAVMMTDIILLDLYNTLGLPTSTTVSIVFELLGASVALSIIKMKHLGQSFAEIGQYINSEKALAIISGILISVIIAFSVGAIVQFLSRLLFSFNYQKSYKRFGAMFGGLAISAITFFMLIKGAKGSSFITPDTLVWIKANTPKIILISFFGWTIILQVLMWISKINIFKLIVIVGTFSLAMAFAGNDLVNFIGVPLAGFESFKTFLADPLAQPDTLLMTALQGKVKTPTIFLLIAGLIMVVTLWTSRKAKSVTKTTLDLSRQGEGDERFNSTGIARVIVRQSRKATSLINYVLPNKFIKAIENRFEPLAQGQGTAAVSFDLVRASVNLVVAAILIAIGTSLKLPLSTTYVTFMVAMGSSLADKAWGRESAVYRITGVMTVVAGWFVTAFFAFSAAFLIALFLNWAGLFAIIVMVLITALLAFRTHIQHKRKNLDTDLDTEFSNQIEDDILNSCKNNVVSGLDNVSILYSSVINGLITEDRKQLKKVVKDITVVNLHAKALKDNIPKTLGKLPAESIDTGHFYIQELDYLREVAHCLNFIGKPAYKHVDNNHKPLISSQAVDLMHLSDQLQAYIEKILHIVNSNSFDHLDEIIHAQQEILDLTDQYRKKQLKRLKSEEVGTRNSMLIIGLLHETRNLTLHLINLAKSHRDFILSQSN
ncbi:MAG: inorganic phosphate transporter, partial [Bacteroidetes bacterium]|nr:inorganic phosphate transporter [Bacteroidota bacterium]